MLIIGSHVSFGAQQILGSVEEALSYQANTFMFYTGAPQNTMRKNIDLELLKEAKKKMQENNIDINHVICHAPYIINLSNKIDQTKWDFSIQFLKQELKRCDELEIRYLVLHPGSAVSYTKEEALNNIVEALNIVLKENYRCQILLETMAGKGTECGTNMDEIKYIIDSVPYPLGVCLDTCHLNDSGIPLEEFDKYLEAFEEKIGLEYIKCVHVNDSKNPQGAHKDRHANLGFGTIGFDNLLKIIYHDKLKEVPKILETPYVAKSEKEKGAQYPPYRFEIQMIRDKKFNENLIEDIISYYNK